MNREDVIKGLECCIIRDPNGRMRCLECPYRDPAFRCVNRLKTDALELLKGQEPPRLMREEDFQQIDADGGGGIPCWKEPKSPTRREGWAVIVYGKWYQDLKAGAVRYWTGKPSTAQKEATPWQ